MRILTRYVLSEVGNVFLLTLISLTTLIMIVGIAKEAIMQGLNVQHMLRLVPYLLPNALLYSVPGTILFAVTNVYGRMAGTNEVVAIKSLGLNPMVFLWPTIVLAILLSFVTVWLNDVAMTWGYFGVQQVVIDSIEDIIYANLAKNHSYSFGGLSINVKRVEGRKLINPTFTFAADGDTPQVTITAQWAELRSKPGSGVLTISCHDGTVDVGGTTFDFPDTLEREIPLTDGGGRGAAPAAHTPLSVLPEQIAQQRLAISRAEQQAAADAGYLMLSGDFAALAGGRWPQRAEELHYQRLQLYRLMTETPRRWANGFSCLCFALVGSCLAIQLRRADALAVFGLCFLPVLFVYYPLLMAGLDRSKSGSWPPISVWLGNVLFLLAGLWLRRKVIRY